MAELADALVSGTSEGSFMQVQVLLSAPTKRAFHESGEPFSFGAVKEQDLNLRRSRSVTAGVFSAVKIH